MPGYSGTPLPQKLGLTPGATLVLLNAPRGFDAVLGDLPPRAALAAKLPRSGARAALMMLFCPDRPALAKGLPGASARLAADGALWIAWPKKASKLFIDLTEDGVREIALPTGLVDVKVCAVTDDWSGLKLMVRKERRAAWEAS